MAWCSSHPMVRWTFKGQGNLWHTPETSERPYWVTLWISLAQCRASDHGHSGCVSKSTQTGYAFFSGIFFQSLRIYGSWSRNVVLVFKSLWWMFVNLHSCFWSNVNIFPQRTFSFDQLWPGHPLMSPGPGGMPGLQETSKSHGPPSFPHHLVKL